MVRLIVALLFTASVISADILFPFADAKGAIFVPEVLANNPPCISARLASCQYSYNSDLNITDGADWSDPTILINDIRNLYLSGIDSFLRVCQARRNFATCLGEQYNSCMSVTNFVKQGESVFNANTYVQFFIEQEFDCVGGFIQSSKNFMCIISVINNNNQTFQDCFNTFFSNTDPNKYCAAANDLENCIRKPFQDTCGNEVSWWECERVRLSMMFDKNCPMLNCGVTINSTKVEEKSAYMQNVQAMLESKSEFKMIIKELAEKAALRRQEF